MSGNVVRIGDDISCGDHVATGSGDVFANGMPITHQGIKDTTGHACFPGTVLLGPWSRTVYVNNNLIPLKGKTTIVPHTCGDSTHGGIVTSGASSVFVEL